MLLTLLPDRKSTKIIICILEVYTIRSKQCCEPKKITGNHNSIEQQRPGLNPTGCKIEPLSTLGLL
jgi:hypothetical protein